MSGGAVTDALIASMMLRRGGKKQLALDLRLSDRTKAMEARWRDVSENENLVPALHRMR